MISFVLTSRDEAPGVLMRTVQGVLDSCGAADREVVVVDDGSVRPVDGLPHDVRLMRNPRPEGVSRARRTGCAATAGDVLIVMDAHLTFGSGWLEAMLAHVDTGALLCGAYWDYERVRHASFGADLVWNPVRDYATGRCPGLRAEPRILPPPPDVHEVPVALGGCYMMARDTYRRLGGFSPLFRVWGADEQDLSMRAWLAGLGVRCVPQAQVGHLTRTTFPYAVNFDDLEFNQLTMIRSNLGFTTIKRLECAFEPVSAPVHHWLSTTELAPWRAVVQRARQWSDADYLTRFLPALVDQAATDNRLPYRAGQN